MNDAQLIEASLEDTGQYVARLLRQDGFRISEVCDVLLKAC